MHSLILLKIIWNQTTSKLIGVNRRKKFKFYKSFQGWGGYWYIYQKAIHVISVEKEMISKFQFYTVRIKDMSLKSSITLVNKHLKNVGLHVL